MKALGKDQEKEKAALVEEIRDAHTELETAINAYNEVMKTEQGKVQEKLEALNLKINEVQGWVEGVSSDMMSYYDEKSEKWQESEAGQNYLEWQDSYERLSTDEVEVNFPDDLEVPECEVADDLGNLPYNP